MTLPEILAPAGGAEQLTAAVRCGADAVYLGLEGQSARRSAQNFTPDALTEAVRYCHARDVRVFLAVNTMQCSDELSALCETADVAAAAAVDGVILQDMAALRLFMGRYPSIHRVASTQTAVHNTDGAKFLQDSGFDSFVLARELSLAEMEKICSAVSIPAEAFVHGAHCVCLSGACYLSAMLGGRSGNRGLCAQPCRLDWRSGGTHYALSMKDMSLIPHIRALAEAGVATLKIEGRMKRPEYVAAAVTACRQARAGEEYDEQSLRAVFSRSGFTDGYLNARRSRDMFGWRTHEDVTGAADVLRSLANLYHKEMPRVPLSMDFSADAGGSRLTVSDGTRSVTAAGPIPEAARNRPLDAEGAEKNLAKTGGTQYYVNNFRAAVAPGLMLPASSLNALRREAIGQLDTQRADSVVHPAHPWDFPAPDRYIPPRSPALWARFYRAEQIPNDTTAFEKIILPTEEITPEILSALGGRLIGQVPAVLFPEREEGEKDRLRGLRDAGLSEIWCDNIYALQWAREPGLIARGGFGLNIANTPALDFYAEHGLASATLSFELSMTRLREIGGTLPRGIAAYGYLPLMRWRSCPLRASIGCDHCRAEGELTDRRGTTFTVECGRRQFSTLLNSVPLHIAERECPFDYLLLYFTRENADEIASVTRDFREHRKANGPHSGGLYYRTLY